MKQTKTQRQSKHSRHTRSRRDVRRGSGWRLFVRWWRAQNKKYGVRWRVANGMAALLMLMAAVLPVVQHVLTMQRYEIGKQTGALIGKNDPTLTKQLRYDKTTGTYSFNKDAVKKEGATPSDIVRAQVGTATGKGRDKSLYALDVPQDMSKGVTYHDINSQLSFTLVPDFDALEGHEVDGHLVFPMSNKTQAIYTLKNNGLKEDIVVQNPGKQSMRFSYHFVLPETLEIKATPNSNGAIGMYSADPNLFGNVTYSTEADRIAVEKARAKSPKTHLVFGLPAPIIKDVHGKQVGNARFELDGKKLAVVAEGLGSVKGPVSIDPSVVITSTSDFQTSGNVDDNIDFNTSGRASRAYLTGGSVGAWTDNTDTGSVHAGAAGVTSVAYNGYLYVVGGNAAGRQVYYAPLNANGSVGAWAGSSTSLNISRSYGALVAYNGYLYAYGGYDIGNSAVLGSVEYSAINTTTGAPGTWAVSENAMYLSTCRMGYAVYSGYLYAVGGANSAASGCGDSSTATTTVQYAPLKGNGDVGTWVNSANQFTTARLSASAVAYNGYLYIVGGINTGGSTLYRDTQYAYLGSNGSVSGWVVNANDTSVGIYRFGMVAYNGYMYILAGTYSGAAQAECWYAPIYANGSIGAWQSNTNNLSSGRYAVGTAFYNGYIYTVGGNDGTNNITTTSYAKVDGPGPLSQYTSSSNTFTTARRGGATVAYGGYLYIMGGDAGGSPLTTVYKAQINGNGTLGSFATTTALPVARTFFGAVAYNGYMYIIGGCIDTLANCVSNSAQAEVTVYSTPVSATGTFSTWTQQTSFTNGRYAFGAVTYNGYVYIMGGARGTTFLNDIQYAQMNAGSITSWTALSSSYNVPTARAAFGVTTAGGMVYVAGGCSAGSLTTCTTRQSDVQYAQLSNTGGFASTWSSGTSFNNARYGLGLVAANGYLYLAGGYNGTAYFGGTQYTPLANNGAPGSWTGTTGFTNSGWGIGMAAVGGNVYVMGGVNGTTYRSTTYYAATNAGGSGQADTFNTDSNTFSGIRYLHGTVYYNGYLYVLGGTNGTNRLTDVQYAPVTYDGTISGAWSMTTDLTSFTTGMNSLTAVANNGYMYIVGGYDGTTRFSTVYYAPINSNGTLGSWAATSAFNAGRSSAQAQIYGGRMYVMGGVSSACSGGNCNDVQYAPINSNGTLGSFSSTTSFTGVRYAFGAAAVNGYMYIMGGTTSTYYNDVQYAPINSNGTLGSWSYTSSFDKPRGYVGVAVYAGYVYIFGGFGGTTYYNDVQYAPINSNGTLGSWSYTSSFNGTRYGHCVVQNGSTVYVVGGWSSVGSVARNDVQSANLMSIARTGHYSRLIDLGNTTNVTGVTYGGTLPLGSSVTYKAADASASFAGSGEVTAISGSGNCSGNLVNVRYVFFMVTVEDSYATAVLPDAQGAQAYVANVTVAYSLSHPSPDVRLRGGKTLQAGTLSGLDTCYP